MPKIPIDYSKTIIYKLVCNDLSVTDLYVGHTTNWIKRKGQHKSDCCNENSKHHNVKVYQFIRENGGWDNWNMVQIEEHCCNNTREATLRERYWYEQLNGTLNSNYPARTAKEQKKEYNEKNKEKLKEYRQANKERKKEYSKAYNQANNEKLKEHHKEYHEANREKILEQHKQYYEANKEEILEKAKEYREANKEELLEYQREYRKANKEKLKEYQKQYRQAKKLNSHL